MRYSTAVAVALVALFALPRVASAHQTSVVYLHVTVDGRFADVEARVAESDLGEPTGRSPLQPPTRAQAAAAGDRVARYLAERIHVTNGGARCEPHPGSTRVDERPRDNTFELAAVVRYACARQIDDLGIHYDLFFDLDPRHQGLAEIEAFGSTRQAAFRADARDARVVGEPSRLAQFGDYLTLGIEHIFTGYDHIAFLLGLLLVAGGMRAREGVTATLGVVTAFTLAHSITLIAAALGLVQLPSRVMETAIAASILYVALENLSPRVPKHRWALTFAFGLVHGFGFASVLRELGLPRSGLVLSLLSFNLGVEVGQLAIVAAVFPILMLVARARWGAREIAAAVALASALYFVLATFVSTHVPLAVVCFGGTFALALGAAKLGYERGARRLGSSVIAAFAVLWIIERLSGHTVLRGLLG